MTDKNGRHVAIFFSALFFRFFFGVCRLDNEPEGSVIKKSGRDVYIPPSNIDVGTGVWNDGAASIFIRFFFIQRIAGCKQKKNRHEKFKNEQLTRRANLCK